MVAAQPLKKRPKNLNLKFQTPKNPPQKITELKTQFQQGQKGGHASKKEIDRKKNIPPKEMYFRRFHTSSIYYLMDVFFDILKKEKKNRKKKTRNKMEYKVETTNFCLRITFWYSLKVFIVLLLPLTKVRSF